MSSERLGAITDGIVAIAATIMVLELDIPSHIDFTGLLEQWPKFLAHFTSFLLIYVLWYNHYLQLKKFEYVSVKIVLLNGLWLAFVSLIPFSTGWISVYPNGMVGQLFYTLNLSLCFILYQLMLNELVKEKADTMRQEINYTRAAIPLYLGIALAFVIAFFYPIYSMLIEVFVVGYNVYLLIRYIGNMPSH